MEYSHVKPFVVVYCILGSITAGSTACIIPYGECRKCSDESFCVFREEICDGVNACQNGEDEDEALCRGFDIHLSPYGCGNPKKEHQTSAYIVGGDDADPHSWPWQVGLRYQYSGVICGGSLITNGIGKYPTVLTAAHCVKGTRRKDWTIVVGAHSLSGIEYFKSHYEVSEIIMHEDYNSDTLDNDIAIMIPQWPVYENTDVNPICITSLPTSVFVGQKCVVTGWGDTTEGGSTSDRLQETYVPVLSDSACTGYYGSAYNASTMLCAGFHEGGKDSCQGDSGGPLACLNAYGHWDLIGIVSWGNGCAAPKNPGVYTDVHKYLSWIKKII